MYFWAKCLNGAADIVIAFAFLIFLFERRFKKPLPAVITVLVCSVCEFFFLPPGGVITVTFMLIVIVAGSFILFKEDPSLIVGGSLAAAYVYCISDLIFTNAAVWATGKPFFALTAAESPARFIIRNFSVLLLVPAFFIMRKIKADVFGIARWILDWIIFGFGLASVLILQEFENAEIVLEGTNALLAAAGSAALYAASMAAMYLFCFLFEKYQLKKRKQLSERSCDHFREQTFIQNENTLLLNKFRHDIVNHLIDIRALIIANDTDSALALLDETAKKAEDAWKDPPTTGDPVADVVIASKSAVCRSKGIEFICKIELSDKIRMDMVDISSLISNLLDNAIEAAEKTEEPHIRMEIFDYNAYHVIRVENNMSEPVAPDDPLRTKKSEPALHGFGLKIIEDIAEKYDGNFIKKADGDHFTATVLIKCIVDS